MSKGNKGAPVSNFRPYLNNVQLVQWKRKTDLLQAWALQQLNILESAFKYDGLPESLPQKEIETQLLLNGYTAITEHEGKLYALYGGLGGEPNEYYKPTRVVGANPYLHYEYDLKINDDCILVLNDSHYQGLAPLLSKYGTLITENFITMKCAQINARTPAIVNGNDMQTKASAEKYFSDIADGEQGIVMSGAFFEGLKSVPYAAGQSRTITEIIELQQYLKASFFNEIGLNANYNMKREAVNGNEADLNNDSLLPLIDNMLLERQEGFKKVNEKYGTNITVQLNSAWLKEHTEQHQDVDGQPQPEEEKTTQEGAQDDVTA